MNVSILPMSTIAYTHRACTNRQNLTCHRQIAAGGEHGKKSAYDFTNMSRQEFDSLFRDSKISVRIPPLILPSSGLDLTGDTKIQLDSVYREKIDFIAHFREMVDYQKSLPDSEANRTALQYYENGFDVLSSLQGKAVKSSIDTQA